VNPSSDIIAFEFCVLSQILLISGVEDQRYIPIALKMFLSGVFLYFAYNTRTIYMFAGFFIVGEGLFLAVKRFRFWGIVYTATIFLGIIIAAIPQYIINYRSEGILSPAVITNGLFNLQLLWGLKLQRYDSTVSNVLETPRVCFVDRSGLAIIQREGIGDEISYAQYFKILFKYPFEMLGIYFRHFVNMLMPVYPENIISNLDKGKTLITGASLIMGTLFGTVLELKKIKKQTWLHFLPVFIPILFIIPGSVEQRYALGLYLFIIGSVSFCLHRETFLSYVRKNWTRILVLFFLISGLMISIWTSTLASIEIEYPPMIPIDYPLFFEK